MALINCELLRQAVFLYVSMLGFIVVHMGNSLFGISQDHTNVTHVRIAGSGSGSGSGAISPDDGRSITILHPGLAPDSNSRERDRDNSQPNPVLDPWEKAATCQTLFQDVPPTPAGPIILLERFNADNMSIPLSECSTIHLQAPLLSMVWCGFTDPEQVMEELYTVSYFLSTHNMDVLIVEGGGHHAGLLSILALSQSTDATVHVISPYAHYLGSMEKSAVLSKLPTPRLFLYHNQISEIRGRVNLMYRPSPHGYRNDCDLNPGGLNNGELNPATKSNDYTQCLTELVSTATLDHASNSLRYAPSDDLQQRSDLLIRVTFTNIHHINGFLDSPDMFSSWCIKVLIVDASLLGKEDRTWLGKRLTRMGYQAYSLAGRVWTEQTGYNQLIVWTTKPFVPR